MAISAPAAATKPSMARRPFMISGPEPAKLEPSGPEKANACARVKEVGTAGAAGTSGAGSAAGSSEALTAVARARCGGRRAPWEGRRGR